ncbi:DeoR/GlpR family DNA-binding transcription regulator [Kitasatospora viridis]|uniref:DeoR family transcriptional regulator n=1 Tax=Kitasatospora viridis TaxID=281105 RepID=A0A561SEM4_9ACTN|nr:DeoR/GlpR family DNA-binding transcription regulator [Kitasatospora viridis]TWF73308.1 DeoR family transcriptional regulator [Kitasatospora viridis]
MTTHTRRARLLDMLGDRHRIDVTEAAEQLGVSAATVRRDLRELAHQQLLTRTHGGAVPAGVSYDLPLRYKSSRRADEKVRIARAAAALVPAGAVVGLTGGTTTSEVARELATRPDLLTGHEVSLTLVTNAINIASELAVRPHVKTVVTGGIARPASYELVGPLASLVLETISLDYAILGVNALDPRTGASTVEETEAGINQAMARRAHTVVIVADSSKLGRRAFATVCPPSEIDVLVTDTDAPAHLVAALRAAGIEVHLV